MAAGYTSSSGRSEAAGAVGRPRPSHRVMADSRTRPAADKAAEAPTDVSHPTERVFDAKRVLAARVDDTTVRQAVGGWK
uniref:Uncharacterized protein n=1 Tax=Halorubrum distributum TaxID=29283 RepID=A0A2R2NVQ4_9EURY|nr:hypothetical protein [Halorubrum litoreum]